MKRHSYSNWSKDEDELRHSKLIEDPRITAAELQAIFPRHSISSLKGRKAKIKKEGQCKIYFVQLIKHLHQ